MASCIWKKRLEAFKEFVNSDDMMRYPVDYCHENDCSVIEQEMKDCEFCSLSFCEYCIDEHMEECKIFKKIKN